MFPVVFRFERGKSGKEQIRLAACAEKYIRYKKKVYSAVVETHSHEIKNLLMFKFLYVL